MKIKYLNSVWCKADKEAIEIIAPHLKYQIELWRQGPFNRQKKLKDAYFINRQTGVFLAGILPRVLKLGKFEIEYMDDEEDIYLFKNVKISKKFNTILRDAQKEVCNNIFKYGRGVIAALTSFGKTHVAAAIIHSLHECVGHLFPVRTLFLVHKKDLLYNAMERFEDFGISCCLVGDSNRFNLAEAISKQVTVASIQTMIKADPNDYMDLYPLCIIDEAHHVNSLKSQYATILKNLTCWNRIGLTGTVPTKKAELFALEGLIGPVISEYTLKEGIENKHAVKPRITLIPVEIQSSIADLKYYSEIYKKGISFNELRNKEIIDLCKNRNKSGKSVLVMVKEIDHGNELMRIVKEKKLGKALFIQGKNDTDLRKKVKDALQEKNLKTVICTNMWNEGIDIPSLNVVIYACSGKSERATLQGLGRGLRTSKGKTELELIDFLDPYKYLAEHTIARLSIYVREGWL